MISIYINGSYYFFFSWKMHYTEEFAIWKWHKNGCKVGGNALLEMRKFLNGWICEPHESISCEGNGSSKDLQPGETSQCQTVQERRKQSSPWVITASLFFGKSDMSAVTQQWLHTLLCSQNSPCTSPWGGSEVQKQREGLEKSLDARLQS